MWPADAGASVWNRTSRSLVIRPISPVGSVRYGIIASSTRGSRGVVEIWSKKMCANGGPCLLLHPELGHLVPDQLDVVLLLVGQEAEHRPDRRILRFFRGLLVLPEILHLVPEREPQQLCNRHSCHLPFLPVRISVKLPGSRVPHPVGLAPDPNIYDWESGLFVSSLYPYNTRCTTRESGISPAHAGRRRLRGCPVAAKRETDPPIRNSF